MYGRRFFRTLFVMMYMVPPYIWAMEKMTPSIIGAPGQTDTASLVLYASNFVYGRKQYITVSGKSTRPNIVEPDKWRLPVTLKNSLIVASTAATAGTVISCVMAWLLTRTKARGLHIPDFLLMWDAYSHTGNEPDSPAAGGGSIDFREYRPCCTRPTQKP